MTAPDGWQGMDSARKPFRCGHSRSDWNVITFPNRSGKNGISERCKQCHREKARTDAQLGRNAVKLVLSLVHDTTLSEGQACKALDIDRVSLRTMLDSHRASPCAGERRLGVSPAEAAISPRTGVAAGGVGL